MRNICFSHILIRKPWCWILLAAFLYAFSAGPVSRAPGGSLKLELKPTFHNKPLTLHTTPYSDAAGNTLYIDGIRFYISHLRLQTANQEHFSEAPSYHLIDAEDSTTAHIRLTSIPEGNYTELSFWIGVDSLANVSGALDGDLDPAKGMYWAWNTGYINAKLTGHSTACKTLHQEFGFHIGGYLSPYQTARKVVIRIPALRVKTNAQQTLTLTYDLGNWFTKTDLSQTNTISTPGKAAVEMADQYKDMFQLIH